MGWAGWLGLGWLAWLAARRGWGWGWGWELRSCIGRPGPGRGPGGPRADPYYLMIAASLGVIAATVPLLRRITGPEVARNE
ncbi:MAG: hypothetical protein ACRDOU_32205 [Streptosporangiaceae bacterium]